MDTGPRRAVASGMARWSLPSGVGNEGNPSRVWGNQSESVERRAGGCGVGWLPFLDQDIRSCDQGDNIGVGVQSRSHVKEFWRSPVRLSGSRSTVTVLQSDRTASRRHHDMTRGRVMHAPAISEAGQIFIRDSRIHHRVAGLTATRVQPPCGLCTVQEGGKRLPAMTPLHTASICSSADLAVLDKMVQYKSVAIAYASVCYAALGSHRRP